MQTKVQITDLKPLPRWLPIPYMASRLHSMKRHVIVINVDNKRVRVYVCVSTCCVCVCCIVRVHCGRVDLTIKLRTGLTMYHYIYTKLPW